MPMQAFDRVVDIYRRQYSLFSFIYFFSNFNFFFVFTKDLSIKL